MALRKVLTRELEVAFSKKSQPVWFRILKYIVIGGLLYFLWGYGLVWIVLPVMIVLALGLHFWYRKKTKGWTRSYGGWKHDTIKEEIKNTPISKSDPNADHNGINMTGS